MEVRGNVGRLELERWELYFGWELSVIRNCDFAICVEAETLGIATMKMLKCEKDLPFR